MKVILIMRNKDELVYEYVDRFINTINSPYLSLSIDSGSSFKIKKENIEHIIVEEE